MQKDQYLLKTRVTLTPLSKQFPWQPPRAMKVSDNDISDTAMTVPDSLASRGRPIYWCM